MTTIAIIVVFFSLGLAARVLVANFHSLTYWLNKLIIYIFLPAIILLKVPFLELSADILVPVGFAWLWLLAGWILVVALSRWQNWPRQTEGALIILVAMGNTSFLGLPLIQSLFGDGVLAYAIFYDQLGSFLVLSTVGLFLVALYKPVQEEGSTVSMKQALMSVVSFPPIITLVIALTLPVESLVTFVADELGFLGLLLMPSALFVIGVQFQARLLPEHRAPLAMGIALKMVIAPLVAVAYLWALSGSTAVGYAARAATVFEAAMPCMITPGLLAINAGIAPRLIATVLGYSTLFASVSLPIVYFLIV